MKTNKFRSSLGLPISLANFLIRDTPPFRDEFICVGTPDFGGAVGGVCVVTHECVLRDENFGTQKYGDGCTTIDQLRDWGEETEDFVDC